LSAKERDQAVALDLRGESLELVEGLGDRVALVREDALPVEDRPRIQVDRDEILLAVVTGRADLERLAVVRCELRPDVADVIRQPLGGEEPHPVAGEPGPDVVRRALEI